MNLFIYSDESGVFDSKHNDYFLFGGLVCFGNEEKEITSRKYSHVEKCIRENYVSNINREIKACRISNGQKGKLFRSLNNVYKFCVIIKQKKLNQDIFLNKKHRQRYLDYAYKMCLKKLFLKLIEESKIRADEIENVYVCADEHSTATDGLYELRENLLNEFKYGTFNLQWNKHFPPIIPGLQSLQVRFCDSKSTLLVRAADIIVNHFYHNIDINKGIFKKEKNTFVYMLPENRMTQVSLEFFDIPKADDVDVL